MPGESAPLSNIIIFGVLGFLAFFAGLGFVITGRVLEGTPPLLIGLLFLFRSWNWLKTWAE